MGKILPLAILAYNTFNTPNLANYSPYEFSLWQKMKTAIRFRNKP